MRRSITLSISMIVAATLLVSSHARADAVGPPPTDCPEGTFGASSHTGPYCAPRLCATNMDCIGMATCQDEPMCIASQACGGLRLDSGPFPDGGTEPPCVFDTVHGLCGDGSACGSGSCETRRVCVVPSAAPAASGCSCSVGARRGAMGASLASALVLAVLFERRRASARS